MPEAIKSGETWGCSWSDEEDEIVVYSIDGHRHDLVAVVDGKTEEMRQARGELIAAAPELLAACESAANWCREYEIQNNGDEGAAAIVAQLREAIAKATGQPAHS